MCVPRVPGDARYVRTVCGLLGLCDRTVRSADETAVPVALTGPVVRRESGVAASFIFARAYPLCRAQYES